VAHQLTHDLNALGDIMSLLIREATVPFAASDLPQDAAVAANANENVRRHLCVLPHSLVARRPGCVHLDTLAGPRDTANSQSNLPVTR